MRALASFALAVAVALAASGASAQREVAQERFRRGEAAYQKGNYALAVSEWQAAYSAEPRPRIQYNLYQAYERLGKLAEAAESLQLYLQTADPDDESYGDATARMASLQQRLQATGIRIVGGVEGAQITVDDTDWGRIPRPDRIPVNAGNHRVVIQREGYQPFTSTVVVPAGQVVDVVAELTLGESPSDAPTTTGDASESTGEAGDGTTLFIVSGVLAAGAVGSSIWMLNRASELDGCDQPEFFCPNESAVALQGNIAIGLTIGLGAGTIGTFVWGLIEESSDGGSAMRCLPGGTGVTCGGRF